MTELSELELELQEEAPKDNRRFLEKMTDWYFRPKSFERSGKLYEALGIKTFKKIVRKTTGIGYDHGGSNYYIGDKRDKASIKRWELKSRINEAIHSPVTIFFGYDLVKNASEGNVGASIFDAVALAINGYCSMLQRYNRARAYNVMERMESREMPALSQK